MREDITGLATNLGGLLHKKGMCAVCYLLRLVGSALPSAIDWHLPLSHSRKLF